MASSHRRPSERPTLSDNAAASWSSPAAHSRKRSSLVSPHHSRQGSTATLSALAPGSSRSVSPSRSSAIGEYSDNAISTLLQRPIIRTGLLPHAAPTSSQRAPSARDIPPVTLSNIPHIDENVLKTYFRQAGALYDALQRAREGPEASRRRSHSRRSSRLEPDASPQLGRRRSSTSSIHSQAEHDPGGFGADGPSFRRRSSGGIRRAPLAVAPLSTIPGVYFEEDFRLENPRTFDVVSERAEIARPPASTNGEVSLSESSGKKALAANAILQEKLSWYMDTVEIHLISSISVASKSFFAALGSLRELHTEAAESVDKIGALRKDLRQLDEGMAAGGLKILALKQRRKNLRTLSAAVEQIRTVSDMVRLCEADLEDGRIEQALQGINNVEHVIAGNPSAGQPSPMGEVTVAGPGAPQDLQDLKALQGIRDELDQLRGRIGKAFETRFVETLLSDLRRHVDAAPFDSTFQRWDHASSRLRGLPVRTPSEMPMFVHVDGSFRAALFDQLKGLARSESITAAAMTYREMVLKDFKNLIRRHLPSSSDEDAESTTSIATHESRRLSSSQKSSILAQNLRSLDADDAEDMFKKIYANIGEALRRLGTQVKVILDITSSLESPHLMLPLKSPPRTPRGQSIDAQLAPKLRLDAPAAQVHQEELQQALDLSSLLGQGVDIAQSQIVKLLKVRREPSTALDLQHFLHYFTLNRLFADECEAISGRSGATLKTQVQEHIKAFIARLAERETQSLIQRMDSDKWEAKDCTEADTARLKRLLRASTNDADTWIRATLLWESDDTAKTAQVSNGAGAAANSNADPKSTDQPGAKAEPVKKHVRGASIDEDKYILPDSALAALTGLETFANLITGIPSMTADVATMMLDYLRLFKSRSSQLVLGAGATHTAGLKNITTKHLALSSQAISFVVALMPHLREFTRRHLPGTNNNIMMDFDRVKRMLQEQQSGLQEKFGEIMIGRARSHAHSMAQVDWDSPSSSAAEPASAYMVALVKETTTLHKVLARYLPATTVDLIMHPVIDNYHDQWGHSFDNVRLHTPEGKARLVRDAEYFKERVGGIAGADELGHELVEIALGKPLPQAVMSERSSNSEETPTTAASSAPSHDDAKD